MRKPPKIVEFEVTTACNLRCIHCYCEAGKKGPVELSLEEIFNVMDDLKRMNVWAFDLVGGEPFVRKDIFEIFKYGKKIGLRMMVNTNGTLVTEDIVKKLKEINPDVMVGVSLDGPDEESNDFVRGKGSFEKALKGLKLFVEYGFEPVILNVINKLNWKKFENMIELAKSLNVNKIYVDRFIPVGRGVVSKRYLDMEDDEWVEAIKFVRNIIDKYKTEMVFYVEENITGDPCTAGLTHASILVDGSVVPCGHFRYEVDLKLGNVRERSFSEIWNSFVPEDLFDLSDECRSCEFLTSCMGGCRAVSLHRYGDFKAKDKILCALRKEMGEFDVESWGY